MSIVAGLDIRRRKRSDQPTGFVLTVLLTAIGVSLAAQVAQAHPSVWGWTVAALPALGLLAVVKIVLSRTTTTEDHATTASRPAASSDRTDNGQPAGHDATVLGRPHTMTTAPSDRTAAPRRPAGTRPHTPPLIAPDRTTALLRQLKATNGHTTADTRT